MSDPIYQKVWRCEGHGDVVRVPFREPAMLGGGEEGGSITASPIGEISPSETGEEALERSLYQTLEQKASSQQELLRLEQCLADYEGLSRTLETLPERVERPILVPHGKMAMFPGKLIHTNEVMVLLGDNYFALRSAQQAAQIATRRAEWVQPQITSKQSEIDELTDKAAHLQSMHEITAQQHGTFEIREEYNSDEDDGSLWLGAGGSGLRNVKQLGAGGQQAVEPPSGSVGRGRDAGGGAIGGGEGRAPPAPPPQATPGAEAEVAAAPKVSRFKASRMKAAGASAADAEAAAAPAVGLAASAKRVSFGSSDAGDATLAATAAAKAPAKATAAKKPCPDGQVLDKRTKECRPPLKRGRTAKNSPNKSPKGTAKVQDNETLDKYGFAIPVYKPKVYAEKTYKQTTLAFGKRNL